ncbi:MAG: chemotaxis response regulator protein-glutamate methylesterase [Parvularculaceae bacterium]
MNRVRVLVVDDSPTMRAIIKHKLRADPEIEVVGEAGDPLEAREAIKALSPDVITLDIEMPNMDGIEFLRRLMRLRPTPVVMVSTLTQNGAAASIEALALGAFDCVPKPVDGDFENGLPNLTRKVKLAARAPVGARNVAPPTQRETNYRAGNKIIAIGSSTGGVEALCQVLESFPENCPPTVITQHMPASFTASFASRLNGMCAPEVMEAFDGAPIQQGRIYIAPGMIAHLEVGRGETLCCRLASGEPVSGHKPSVDVLFRSVAPMGSRVVAAILTGMGRDGAEGLLEIRRAGGRTVGQDEATSVVYGMPRAAFELGGVETQLPLSKIGPALLKLGSKQEEGRASA